MYINANSINTPVCHTTVQFNPLKTQLNPICHLLALLGAHHILHVSRIRVNKEQQMSICLKAAHCKSSNCFYL